MSQRDASDLSPLRDRLTETGAPLHLLGLWFASTLREVSRSRWPGCLSRFSEGTHALLERGGARFVEQCLSVDDIGA